MSDPSNRPGSLTVTIDLHFNEEAEQRAIGLVLQWPKTWVAFQKLMPEDFFNEINSAIWSCIRTLKGSGLPCDLASVVMQMSPRLGGMGSSEARNLSAHLTTVAMNAVDVGSTGYQDTARLLTELADKRRFARKLVKAAKRISESLVTDTAAEIAREHVAEVHRDRIGGTLVTASQLIQQILDTRFDEIKVYPTGMPRLDKAIGGGLAENEYTVIGGRMGGFKTTFLSTISHNLIDRETPVPHDYYCLEQTDMQIFKKMLVRQISEIYSRQNGLGVMLTANVFRDMFAIREQWFGEALEAAMEWYSNRGLRFLPQPSMDIAALRSEITSAGLEGSAKGVIVDYVQLVRSPLADKGQTTAHLDFVHQTLAQLATSNPLWIVGAVQLNQTNGVRGGEGAMAAASTVMHLHKVEEQRRNLDDGSEAPRRYRAWIEVRKNRHDVEVNIGGDGLIDEETGERNPDPAYLFDTDVGPCLREMKNTILVERELDRAMQSRR